MSLGPPSLGHLLGHLAGYLFVHPLGHRQRPVMSPNPRAHWLPHRQRPVMSLNPRAWLSRRQYSVDGILGIGGTLKPREQATDQEDTHLSTNPEGSGGVTVPGFLVCETSKAFGARWSKFNCREVFALGTGSLSRVLGSGTAVTAEMVLENSTVSRTKLLPFFLRW